jgi:hypothetical protein
MRSCAIIMATAEGILGPVPEARNAQLSSHLREVRQGLSVDGTLSATRVALPGWGGTQFCVRKSCTTWEPPYGIEP